MVSQNVRREAVKTLAELVVKDQQFFTEQNGLPAPSGRTSRDGGDSASKLAGCSPLAVCIISPVLEICLPHRCLSAVFSRLLT